MSTTAELASVPVRGKPAQNQGRPDRFRADIQGLRAIAVSLVLLYHLWPNRLTGGFIGVDVFFVISGFLITSHLVGSVPTRGADLVRFWAKRIRRLLPAALLVLAATLIGSRLFAPETQWDNTAREVMAATVYGENWRLAQTSVDYLASENAASPVQHFWSLSVEEQFYLFWPILILLLAGLARRRGLPTLKVVLAGLVVVVGGSLAYSIQATSTEPASAYFVTPTRMWELGAGALLAVMTRLAAARLGRDAERERAGGRWTLLAWLGLAAVALTAVTYTGATPFPGWQALLPVLGTVAVIGAAAAPAGLSPTRLLRLRPVQWMGDISYSVYLWHWPLIALLPAVSGGHLGRLDKFAILVASLVLGTLSKRYVEDAFRFGRRVPGIRRTYVLAAVAMSVVLVLAGLQVVEIQHRQQQARAELEQALSGDNPCFGAAAWSSKVTCQPVPYSDILPSPADAAKDKSDAYSDNCWVYPPFRTTKSCIFGDKNGQVSIALLGNSHAGHWLPALQEIAKQKHWKITTFLASECTPSTTPVQWDTDAKQAGCLKWAKSVQRQIIKGHFDLVVASNRNGHPAVGLTNKKSQSAWQAGYRDYLSTLDRAGVHVSVIHDNPFPGKPIPDCLAENPDQMHTCDGRPDRWVPRDPMVAAAEELHSSRLSTVDLTRYFCDEQSCPAVIGGVIVYFDGSHITKTYSRTLAPYLLGPLTAAVAKSR
ncbi:acyltransferase family protein [Microlunatus panaciterrae]|uniref:Peptidoglycan/LPS O-acetylase OafA/YrhL n=1 Tax=Microlunatus panaciterrae TaxID=400768 RepID=A0ABS2RE24_9ACTN|nr:peptidoglycan/LPS O-acetylase OafA/YrhL [Microlunatus panaciterrae]